MGWQSCIAFVTSVGLVGAALCAPDVLAQERFGAPDVHADAHSIVGAARAMPTPMARPGSAALPLSPAEGLSIAGSISVGRHNTGRLLFGREIHESEHIRLKNPLVDQHHGTDELVGLIERAAAAVAAQFPGSQLTVGDLSRRRGGRLRPHLSHRTGRDADLGFYLSDEAGNQVFPERFMDVRPDLTVRPRPEWRFDVARNWTFVAAMLGQDEAPIQFMFVHRTLKARLLAYAESIGADPAVIERATIVLDQPRRGGRHEDHFHVRIFCPTTDRPRCLDDGPLYPWIEPPSAETLSALRHAHEAARRGRTATPARRSRRR